MHLYDNNQRRFTMGMFRKYSIAFFGAWLTAGLLALTSPSLAQEKPAGDAAEKAIKTKRDEKKLDDKKLPEKKRGEKKPADKKPAAKKPDADAKSREAAALAFVHENHPELESLLSNLKQRQPKQYEAAIRDLSRHRERLAGARERDAGRYELELQSWKLQSRVQLLSASLLMTPDDETAKAKLKEALVEQLHARRALVQFERDQAAKRLEKLDEQLKRLDADVDKTVERQLKLILQRSRPKVDAAN